MKNKIKDVLLYIGVFYMTVIVGLMIITYCKTKTSVELTINNEYQDKLNEYKEIVNSKEKSTCKEYMNSLIEKIENDINTEEINFKEYYEKITSNNNLLYYYSKAMEDCHSVTREAMNELNMPVKFLTSPVISDEIVGKYIYQYELSFSDIKTRNNNETNLIPVENNIRISNEL